MATSIDNFYYNECDKIDAQKVNAYFKLSEDASKPKELTLENSWEDTSIDMTNIVNAAETHTTMKLSPADDPVYLDYQGESKEHQCIHGDDLSRILTLSKLKDVSQDETWTNGTAPVWDADNNIFVPFNVRGTSGGLETRVSALEDRTAALESALRSINDQLLDVQDDQVAIRALITELNTTVQTLKTTVEGMDTRVTDVETTLTKPDNVPTDSKVMWGDVNIYTKTDKSVGAFTHDPATATTGDRTINNDVS